MPLIKWEPFGELDRLFDEGFFSSSSKLGWDLAVDVYQEGDKVIAKMSLPGVGADDIDVYIEGETVTITGRRNEEEEVENKDYYSKEIRRGSFSRTATIPAVVDAEKASAEFDNGMLVITMPVVKGAKEKMVQVKVNK